MIYFPKPFHLSRICTKANLISVLSWVVISSDLLQTFVFYLPASTQVFASATLTWLIAIAALLNVANARQIIFERLSKGDVWTAPGKLGANNEEAVALAQVPKNKVKAVEVVIYGES